MRVFTLVFCVLMLVSCSQKEDVTVAVDVEKKPLDLGHDYFSFANTDQFVTDHLKLDLTVDFDHKELRGLATLKMRRLDSSASHIILDTRDLHVGTVQVNGIDADFLYAQSDPVLGQALEIALPPGQELLDTLSVEIHYKTDPGASALQWLPPELTAGGKHPFMFSQSQSIHARSWVPLQDTPVGTDYLCGDH